MTRIAAILAIFILLMNGRHLVMRAEIPPAAMAVAASPIDPGDLAALGARPGEPHYLGGWSLKASHPFFGGLSALHITDDGFVTGLSDTGQLATFRAGLPRSPGRWAPLPALPGKDREASYWDTESMTMDPASGRIWVGFEMRNRICRFNAAFAAMEHCAFPPAMASWPQTKGIESLARLPDGRFLAIGENAPAPHGGHDMLLWAGDPVESATPPPIHLEYHPPLGYLPTDAIAIGPDRLLVMNRRVTIRDGFIGAVTLVDISDLTPGRILTGKTVLSLSAPRPHDNFEGLAMSRENGVPILWIVSDDNRLFFQRTLLLKFAMPPQWFGAK